MVCIRLLAGRLESYPERYEMIRKWIAGPLLALLAAYVQEVSFQQGGPAGALVQTGPFTAVQVK